MFYSDIDACPITRFGMYDYPAADPLTELTGSEIAFNIEETSIEVTTGFSYVKQVLVYSFVEDKVADNGLRLDITVCGLETLEPNQKNALKFKKM